MKKPRVADGYAAGSVVGATNYMQQAAGISPVSLTKLDGIRRERFSYSVVFPDDEAGERDAKRRCYAEEEAKRTLGYDLLHELFVAGQLVVKLRTTKYQDYIARGTRKDYVLDIGPVTHRQYVEVEPIKLPPLPLRYRVWAWLKWLGSEIKYDGPTGREKAY